MKYISKFFLISSILLQGVSMASEIETPTAGYFPPSFPRDPVEVNLFLEHILVGQIIEPLVETGMDGIISPAVASNWEVSKDGLTITFHIREGLKFSDGNPVTSEDVKYTLERHAKSAHSQSREYLQRIHEMLTPSKEIFVIKLLKPYIAIFKALSRDQLGIIPKNWKFDKNSNEPFTGSGAYRCIRKDGIWQLKRNEHYRNYNSVQIDKWKILLGDVKTITTSGSEIPNIVPFLFKEQLNPLKTRKDYDPKLRNEEKLVQFFQSSAWWYPYGKTYQDHKRRQLGLLVASELINLRIKNGSLTAATGVIPKGITGYKKDRESIDLRKELSNVQDRNILIAAFPRDFKTLYNESDIKQVSKSLNVKLTVVEESNVDVTSIQKLKPDVWVFSYAGGFHDPEGFLTVITSDLGKQLKEVLGNTYNLYESASTEIDWAKRDEKYQALNKALIDNFIMVPGWRYEAFRLRSNTLIIQKNNLRYTPKLMDYGFRKEAI